MATAAVAQATATAVANAAGTAAAATAASRVLRSTAVSVAAASTVAAATEIAKPTPTAILPPVVAPVTGQPADTPGALPLTYGEEMLLLLRDAPELAADDVLLPFITQQIKDEAAAWKSVDAYKQQRIDEQKC